MSQAEDMDAINVYFHTQPVKTPAAQKLKDQWIINWDKISWWDKNFYGPVYDWARNRRNEFDTANATTPAEQAKVVERQKTGVSTEEMQGLPDRRLSSGQYVDPPPPGKEPFVPTRVKVAAGIAGAAFVALWGLKKLYIDPWLPRR